jgi:predicted TIM-barrel fold metal-dependent hydrolase
MLIDLHGHTLTPGMLGKAGHWGPEIAWDENERPNLRVGNWVLRSLTYERRRRQEAGLATDPLEQQALGDPKARVELMTKLGVDQMVLSVPAHCYMYWAEPEIGISWARAANDELAKYSSASDRLHFWATLPMRTPSAAVEEAARAVRDLGAKGFSLGGANLGGRELDDPAFFPLYEKCCELDVPLFIHGFTQAEARGESGVEDRYDLTSFMGFLYDETAAFCNLIMGGVLDTFPQLQVYITHGGGMVPYHLRRIDMMAYVAHDSKNKKPIPEYLGNFWFDLLLHSPAMRKAVVEDIGTERLVYGDNFLGSEYVNGLDYTADIGLSEAQREQVRSLNAKRLLQL